MSRLELSLAISEYDHVHDLVSGAVPVNGIELVPSTYSVEEIFFRFTAFSEWDVSEMSMANFCARISRGATDQIGIPVFPSRVFRQSSAFVCADGAVRGPADLRGKKVGVPEWAQTAGVYARGWLAHDVGIPLAEIDWYQAGVNEPGREEKVPIRLPDGVCLTPVPERTLTEMLLDGTLDAVLTAHPPAPFERGDRSIALLVPDFRRVEEQYYRDTGIFPIMHVIALRREVYEANRWIAVNLWQAFEEAKRRSYQRALTFTASRLPFAWCHEAAHRARALFGDDMIPYGIEPNRVTLEAFLEFAHEQGVCERRVAVEELFVPEVQRPTYKI